MTWCHGGVSSKNYRCESFFFFLISFVLFFFYSKKKIELFYGHYFCIMETDKRMRETVEENIKINKCGRCIVL